MIHLNYGLKEHTSVDVHSGFVLATTLTLASASVPEGRAFCSERAYRARFTTILKNIWDTMCRQMAFNMFRGSKLLANA